jgi:hypothetical protein
MDIGEKSDFLWQYIIFVSYGQYIFKLKGHIANFLLFKWATLELSAIRADTQKSLLH